MAGTAKHARLESQRARARLKRHTRKNERGGKT
jgi:hypothetical protein